MQQYQFPFTRLIATILVGGFVEYKLIENADSSFMLDAFMFLILLGVYIPILIYGFTSDRRGFRSTGAKKSFIPSITGLLLGLGMITTQLILNSRDSSSVIIQASNDGGFNGCGFEFREDGTYKFFNSGGLGVHYLRGTYTMKDSLITLDKMNIDNCTESNLMVIHGKVIHQIDANHQVVDKDMDFTINIDRR